uniref:ATPase asna-1 n=1 Tax=Caenorhabditis japonica TaxID=281687 RepID=A0A8R1E270_CAEJA
MTDQLEPSITNILEQKSLKWIFVGGKGGVGKTTCSCSLAAQLSKVRERVLLISTDPAHNISDAFCQKFTKTPSLVEGFTNLFAMEIDSNPSGEGFEMANIEEMLQNAATNSTNNANNGFSMGKELLQNFAGGLPGIDEAMSFGEMIKLIDSLDFDVVVFDTAPTGHTLRLLQFPTLLEKMFTKILSLQGMFGPLLNNFGGMFGMGGGAGESMNEMVEKMNQTLEQVKKMNQQFKDPNCTTFVCVCIAEFLSLYETERLIQELSKQGIDTHNIIVNQLLFPDKDESGHVACRKCGSRHAIQAKYLSEIDELYEDFHVIKLPLLEKEVRGGREILNFSERMANPKLNTEQ